MKRIALIVAALGLIAGSGTALAQHSGGHGGGGGGWHGGGHGGWHGGGHWHGGTTIGIGFGFPGYYWGYPYYAGYPYYTGYPYAGYPYYAGYPAYYADEPAYADPGPATYVQRERGAVAAPSSEGQYLYYCPNPAGYYPQVQSCANGWLKVVPDGSPAPRPRS